MVTTSLLNIEVHRDVGAIFLAPNIFLKSLIHLTIGFAKLNWLRSAIFLYPITYFKVAICYMLVWHKCWQVLLNLGEIIFSLLLITMTKAT